MKISKGDKLEEITLPKDDGSTFNLSETHGKKVLLTFYRIAGCSFCNLRLNEINKRFNELGNNFTHVAIFDEDFKYFQKYEIERSMMKTLSAMLFKSHKIIPAMLKGYIPLKIKGHFDIAVTDVLINEQGTVDEVYYAKKDIADHFSFEKIKEFATS